MSDPCTPLHPPQHTHTHRRTENRALPSHHNDNSRRQASSTPTCQRNSIKDSHPPALCSSLLTNNASCFPPSTRPFLPTTHPISIHHHHHHHQRDHDLTHPLLEELIWKHMATEISELRFNTFMIYLDEKFLENRFV